MLMLASALMYNHRTPKDRVDVVDLDPYGTAAPFIDSAVQCVNDGGASQFCTTFDTRLTRVRAALRDLH